MSVSKTKQREAFAVQIEPMLSIEDLARVLSISRRSAERYLSAGKLPRPDLRIGKMPRWRPETVRGWIDQQAKSN